jgi:hypothetical protein
MDPNVPQVKFSPFFGTQMGVPGSDTPLGIRHGGGGNVYYVGDSAATHYEATDVNDGTDPRYPKATIQDALDACRNNYGDVVVVFPGNYELTETLTMTLNRVRIFSWDYFRGESAPSVAVTSATDDFDLLAINADQIEIAGIRWANGTDDTNSCIVIGTTGAVVGCYIHDCKFAVGGGYGIEVGSAAGTVNDCTIRHNTFTQIDDNQAAAGVLLNYVVRADVDENLFLSDQAGTYGVSIRNAATGGSIVRNNDFFVEEAAGVAIYRDGNAVDAMICRNMVSGGPTAASAITQRVDGGNYAVENYVSTDAGGAIIDATT